MKISLQWMERLYVSTAISHFHRTFCYHAIIYVGVGGLIDRRFESSQSLRFTWRRGHAQQERKSRRVAYARWLILLADPPCHWKSLEAGDTRRRSIQRVVCKHQFRISGLLPQPRTEWFLNGSGCDGCFLSFLWDLVSLSLALYWPSTSFYRKHIILITFFSRTIPFFI